MFSCIESTFNLTLAHKALLINEYTAPPAASHVHHFTPPVPRCSPEVISRIQCLT